MRVGEIKCEPEFAVGLTWLCEGDDFRGRLRWCQVGALPVLLLDLHTAVLGHTAHVQLLDGVEQCGSRDRLREVGPGAQVQHVENVTFHGLHHVVLIP